MAKAAVGATQSARVHSMLESEFNARHSSPPTPYCHFNDADFDHNLATYLRGTAVPSGATAF
jgi:hypothetical protein